VFRIARKVARDRIISTVDPEARHGHKTAAKGFDGYKGHAAADPDSEIITATAVTAGNVGDGSVAEELIGDLLDDADRGATAEVFGDAAYGTGSFQNVLENNQIISGCKTQSVSRRANALFTKDRFVVDLDADTVTCPNQVTVTIGRHDDGSGTAKFGPAWAMCPMRTQCTSSRSGRTISIHTYEAVLVRARARNQDPVWRARYRETRPKIERKLGHLMRRKHGGRHARVRGRTKIDADFSLLAAAVNLARLALKGLTATRNGWTIAT
jgi:Transposase DDE domain